MTNFRIGRLMPYAVSALVIPAAFAVIYALTWLARVGDAGLAVASPAPRLGRQGH